MTNKTPLMPYNFYVTVSIGGFHEIYEYVSEHEGTDVPCAGALFYALHLWNYITHGVDNNGDEFVAAAAGLLHSWGYDPRDPDLSVNVCGIDPMWTDGAFEDDLNPIDIASMENEGLTREMFDHYCLSHPDYTGGQS